MSEISWHEYLRNIYTIGKTRYSENESHAPRIRQRANQNVDSNRSSQLEAAFRNTIRRQNKRTSHARIDLSYLNLSSGLVDTGIRGRIR